MGEAGWWILMSGLSRLSEVEEVREGMGCQAFVGLLKILVIVHEVILP